MRTDPMTKKRSHATSIGVAGVWAGLALAWSGCGSGPSLEPPGSGDVSTPDASTGDAGAPGVDASSGTAVDSSASNPPDARATSDAAVPVRDGSVEAAGDAGSERESGSASVDASSSPEGGQD